MKYIGFWEFDPKDFDKVLKKYVDQDSWPDFPETISEGFGLGGEFRGFQLYETDNPEHLTNLSLYYMPEMEFNFIPIFEVAKVVERYQEIKK